MKKIKRVKINGKDYVNYMDLLESLDEMSKSLQHVGDILGHAYVHSIVVTLKEEGLYEFYPKKVKGTNVTDLFGEINE